MQPKTPMQRVNAYANQARDIDQQIAMAFYGYTMISQEQRQPSYATREHDVNTIYDRERTKAQDALEREYREEIGSWDWRGIVADALSNMESDPDDDSQLIGACYLGSILNLYPSGKVYAPWTSNQTDYGVMRDEVFASVLEEFAEANGGWIGSSEGDGCDILFYITVPNPESEDSDDSEDE